MPFWLKFLNPFSDCSPPPPPTFLAQELKRRKKSVETLAVLKNGVHFTTPELKKLGWRYKECRLQYEEKQSGLVEKAVETAATYLPLVESASALVGEQKTIQPYV